MNGQIFSADLLAKMTSPFPVIDAKWGPHTIDRFACITTPRFQGSTLKVPPLAAAVLAPCPRIRSVNDRLKVARSMAL